MSFLAGKRKIVTALAGLLCFMLLCTLISKSVYASQLPQVTAETAKKRELGRIIKVSGSVIQSREYAVSTLPSIRVDAVEVGKGDAVEEGSLLFSLDLQDLREQIAQQELAVKKLEVQIATLQHNQSLADGSAIKNTDRLLEDYIDAASEKDIAIERARIQEEEADADLKKHLADAPQLTDEAGRKEAWDIYNAWVERGKRLQEEAAKLTRQLAEAQREVEAAQKALEEAQGTSGQYFALQRVRSVDPQQSDNVELPGDAETSDNAELSCDAEESDHTEPSDDPEPSDQEEQPDHTEEQPDHTEEQPDHTEKQPDHTEEQKEGEPSDDAEQTEENGGEGDNSSDLEELKRRLQQAEEKRDALAAKLEDIQDKLQKHQAEGAEKPDFSVEDAEQKSWEAQSETLRRNAESADWAYEDALRQKEEALKEAQRKVDDSLEPQTLQDTLVLDQLELSWLKEVLAGYRKLQDAEGKIVAPKKGVVTDVRVSAGSDTPDGAAVVYADREENLEFRMTVSKEDKKYINQGSIGSLQIGNRQGNCRVDYMEQQADGSYLAVVSAPEGMGSMGESGTFVVSWQSSSYPCCVPVGALHEENKRNFIYVVRRQQGILGEELAAEKRFVTVLEEGDRYAALEASALQEDEEVILTSTKELKDGEVIRYRLAGNK